ncbi:MAG: glycosyltransferase family 9 protein, partial [Cytophagaceae bacterium]
MLKQAGWNNLKNILCIRLDNLGDVLMTTPAIRALKEQMPGRRITLLSSRAGSTIARYVREIDDIIVFDTPWEKNPDPAARHFAHNLVEQLKQRNFDAAVIFTVYSQNPLPAAMLCYLAGIPRVAGYCRENPYGLITHWIPDEEPVYEIKHEVTRQMDLVKFLGMEAHDDSLSLSVPENTILDTMNRLLKTGIDPDKKWVIIHPGVSEAKRQYPVELFAEAAKTILEDEDMQILLTGTEAEKELTEHIQQTVGPGVFNLAGMLSIGELC